MIIKTEAIVLKTVDYSESSIIATLFTREKGKVAVIAKGARKPKNKFSAFLVAGQLLEAVFYNKDSRSVQTLSELSYSEKLHSLRTDIEKMAIATITMELINQVIHENEENSDLFEFLKRSFVWVENQKEVPASLFPYIQLRVADYIGIGVQMDDPAEIEQAETGYLNISSGILSTTSVDSYSERFSQAQFAFVKKTLHSANASILRIVMDAGELGGLIRIIDRYFTYHVEGLKQRRSDKIFEQLLMK